MGCKNMKGFIFTLDAVFSLVVAAVGISILLYASYTSSVQYGYALPESYNLLHSLLQRPIASSLYMEGLDFVNASQISWPQFGHDAQLSSSSLYSPMYPYLLYTYSVKSQIFQSVAVNKGFAVFAAGSNLYIINATTGKLYLSNTPTGSSNIIAAPLMYKNLVFYANSSNFVGASYLYGANSVWSFNAVNSIYSQLNLANNFLLFGTTNGFYLLNPFNGTVAGYASTNGPAQTPVYANGEYIVSTSSKTSQNYLYSFALVGSSLVNLWSVALSSGQTTPPTILNNTIGVGSGTNFYIIGIGGGQIANANLGSQIRGIAAVNNMYYVETSQNIYEYTANGTSIFSAGIGNDRQNSTPSYGSSVIYTLVNGNTLEGFSASQYKQSWNVTLPSRYMSNYSNIALAYGNMYVPNGNTLYVFGTYKAQPSDSTLQIISDMYLNNQSDYSNILLNNLYNTTNTGIFINNTYAPTLSVAGFNSMKSSYVEQANGFPWMNNAITRFSISVWINASSSNGVIVDELDPSAGWHQSFIELVNNMVYIRTGSSCSPLGAVNKGAWNNIAITYSGSQYVGYINGALANTIAVTRTVPGGGGGMYYPLGLGDSSNCGSGLYFNGSMLNYQFYNSTLNSTYIGQTYLAGAFGIPSVATQLFLPLDGNANDFSGRFNLGYAYGIVYKPNAYLPKSLLNSFQVSKATAPISLRNSNNINKLYNVSVVEWR